MKKLFTIIIYLLSILSAKAQSNNNMDTKNLIISNMSVMPYDYQVFNINLNYQRKIAFLNMGSDTNLFDLSVGINSNFSVVDMTDKYAYEYENAKTKNIYLGPRFAIHNSFINKSLELYAGLDLGAEYIFGRKSKNLDFRMSAFAGMNIYVFKGLALNLEMSQPSSSVFQAGLSYRF